MMGETTQANVSTFGGAVLDTDYVLLEAMKTLCDLYYYDYENYTLARQEFTVWGQLVKVSKKYGKPIKNEFIRKIQERIEFYKKKAEVVKKRGSYDF